jgi:hypothetical protein
MSNARYPLAFTSKRANGNHVSPSGPLLLKMWGTSRFATPLPAHWSGAVQ